MTFPSAPSLVLHGTAELLDVARAEHTTATLAASPVKAFPDRPILAT